MLRMTGFWAVAACLAAAATPAHAQINAGLYTTYNVSTDKTSVSWLTCGSTAGSEGCFGSGALTGFGKVCAMLEDTATIKGDTVTQHVFVFDSDFKKGATLYLDAYLKKDVITESYDTTTFKLQKRVKLGIPAGDAVACYAAANNVAVYAGTSTSTSAAVVNLADYSVQLEGGFSPPAPVTSIQADDRGFVTVNFGNGFYLYGPTGLQEDGGGNQVLLNPLNAYIP